MDTIRSAFISIWSNKIRSLLTVLGIVIGVASVTILVSLGEGLKNQVSELIRGFGSNIIFLVPGKIDTKNASAMRTNPANFISTDVITIKDLQTIKETPGVEALTPMVLVPGNIRYKEKVSVPTLAGVYSSITTAMEILKIKEGDIFSEGENRNVIILGPKTKEELFGEDNALGKVVLVGKEEFIVKGVFAKVEAESIFGSEFDTLSVIPFDTATRLDKGVIKINRVSIKVSDDAQVHDVKEKIHKALLKNHKGEENFSLLTQDDILGLFDDFLSLATTLVSAIAAISLVVGGIGIMNIMLVTVTERTKEIGIRKAVGATKLNIALQFLVEAIFVTLLGGLLGLLVAFFVGWIVATKTPLQPKITIDIIITALSISTVIGIVFGLWPAIRAANKDPIEALRYE